MIGLLCAMGQVETHVFFQDNTSAFSFLNCAIANAFKDKKNTGTEKSRQ